MSNRFEVFYVSNLLLFSELSNRRIFITSKLKKAMRKIYENKWNEKSQFHTIYLAIFCSKNLSTFCNSLKLSNFSAFLICCTRTAESQYWAKVSTLNFLCGKFTELLSWFPWSNLTRFCFCHRYLWVPKFSKILFKTHL